MSFPKMAVQRAQFQSRTLLNRFQSVSAAAEEFGHLLYTNDAGVGLLLYLGFERDGVGFGTS
jgi:hypothetical protein